MHIAQIIADQEQPMNRIIAGVLAASLLAANLGAMAETAEGIPVDQSAVDSVSVPAEANSPTGNYIDEVAQAGQSGQAGAGLLQGTILAQGISVPLATAFVGAAIVAGTAAASAGGDGGGTSQTATSTATTTATSTTTSTR